MKSTQLSCHLISSHPISSHLISSHLISISSHLISIPSPSHLHHECVMVMMSEAHTRNVTSMTRTTNRRVNCREDIRTFDRRVICFGGSGREHDLQETEKGNNGKSGMVRSERADDPLCCCHQWLAKPLWAWRQSNPQLPDIHNARHKGALKRSDRRNERKKTNQIRNFLTFKMPDTKVRWKYILRDSPAVQLRPRTRHPSRIYEERVA